MSEPSRSHEPFHVVPTLTVDPPHATRRGIWALKVSLVALLITALFQIGIALSSGSVALLADTIHNFSDALTAIPLWLAFNLTRRAQNRRYTYGYGRAEDLAGAAIVVLIFLSGIEVFYQAIQKIINPMPVSSLGWVALAAFVGFLGNELAATFRLRIGREIHSAALEADGRHSQVDGFTSLGVLIGVIGVWLGIPLADPIIGFLIGSAILWTAWGAGRELWYRLMDAADPKATALVDTTAASIPGVLAVNEIHSRWLGHRQYCELNITVNAHLPTSDSHRIAENVRHELFHTLPAIQNVIVHVDPFEDQPGSEHLTTAHHNGLI